MEQPSPPPQPDLTLPLPRDAYWQVVQYLRTSLPHPITDSPEDLARRDRAAIAEVASLLPGTTAEATLAAQYVAANAQAMDALREVRAHAADPPIGMKCSAQSACMMRQARGAIGTLQRMQDRRRKVEANYSDRAALIRRHGGVPANARFGPPAAHVERELVNGRSPALLALDREARGVA